MNASKIALGVVAAFVARAVLNVTWYGVIRASASKALIAAHPGVFRDSITNPTPFVVADFLACIVIVLLLSRVASALGGGMAAGIKLGIFLGLLGPVLASIYEYFSFSFMAANVTIVDGIYQIVAHAIVGGVAGAVLARGAGQARAASA